jgi:Cu/Ag efflux protein CusF
MMLKLKKRLALIYILVIVAIFTYFISKQLTQTQADTHYDTTAPVLDVISNGPSVSHFKLSLDKGSYGMGDAVYVKLADSKMHYAKYLLTLEDVQLLETNALELQLKSIAGVSSYRDRMEYTVIEAKNVEAYEIENTSQKTFNLVKPNFMIDELKGSIVDLKWTSEDYAKNDEKMNLYFYQSQLYQAGYSLVVKVNNEVKKEITISEEDIQTLNQSFMTLQIDLADTLDDYEEGSQNLYFTILLKDHESKTISQNYILIKRP